MWPSRPPIELMCVTSAGRSAHRTALRRGGSRRGRWRGVRRGGLARRLRPRPRLAGPSGGGRGGASTGCPGARARFGARSGRRSGREARRRCMARSPRAAAGIGRLAMGGSARRARTPAFAPPHPRSHRSAGTLASAPRRCRKDGVLQRREIGQQMVGLKHEADVPVAKLRQLRVVGLHQVFAQHLQPPRGRAHQRAQNTQQR